MMLEYVRSARAEGAPTEPSPLSAPNTAHGSPLRQRLARYGDVSLLSSALAD